MSSSLRLHHSMMMPASTVSTIVFWTGALGHIAVGERAGGGSLMFELRIDDEPAVCKVWAEI
jgi:hypothetical protein